MSTIDWYGEFVDMEHEPEKEDIIALFSFEPPEGMSRAESAGRIASESSTGTWTTLSNMPKRMDALKATSYWMRGDLLKVSYPSALWERGNFAQLKSGIAGNIFGMKGVRSLRLIDVRFPPSYVRAFKGPLVGMEGIRKRYKVYKRPLTGAVPKPKIGFSAAEHARVGFETWMGGFDFVKDDENLSSLSFNKFDKRVELIARYREKAERLTGERKGAFVNITAETEEMKRRARVLHDHGFDYVMMDVVIVGTSALQTMRAFLSDLGMTIHAHRAMHASFTRDPHHGISMQFLAKEMRLIGMDQLHTGTAVGKLVGTETELESLAGIMRLKRTPAYEGRTLEQDWGRIKSAFPVASGGLHPGLVPDVMRFYGNDMVLLVSGGIHGHPKGTRRGAEASMQAIEAFNDGISLKEKARSAPALGEALEKWGSHRPV
ncbi:MAG: type III ribulose-bisphosphate carboxylase [Candidatus Thermoplasmatota archaeon]|nr:type III ribulose-bisphosphate carboxylase [Candidatus Thermoplasmatota archaeon]